jgi:membrane AbrB-like protein
MAEVRPDPASAAPAAPAGAGDWALAVAVAMLLGWLAREAGIPAGIVFGSSIGAATIALGRDRTWRARPEARVVLMLAVGVMAGLNLTPEVLGGVPQYLVGATLTTVLLVIGSFSVVLVLARLHRAPPGGVLATLPGALEALTAVAAGQRAGASELAWFHTVRVLIVVFSVPLLIWLGS